MRSVRHRTHLLAKFVDVLGTSADELLGIKPMRAARPVNQRLLRRVRLMEKLPAKERKQLLSIIDTFLDRHRWCSGRSDALAAASAARHTRERGTR